jgi:streptomycin 6-kinase
MFGKYLGLWQLTADGDTIATPTSMLLPVQFGEIPAILKIALHDNEKRGGRLMRWWNGEGAASVLAWADDAILLERAQCEDASAELVRNGRDDEACGIICAVVQKLHAPRSRPPPSDLVPLTSWFQSLFAAAETHGGILRTAAAVAAELLANQRDLQVLHGDIHHGNILDFGLRGWLAIDPKGLIGERGFDYANLFCNPDFNVASTPGRLARQVNLVADTVHLEAVRLRQWVLAWTGLSAAFFIEDDLSPIDALQMAELAAAELRR